VRERERELERTTREDDERTSRARESIVNSNTEVGVKVKERNSGA